MILVNGKNLAEKKFSEIEEEIKGKSLSLAVVQIGEDPASAVYVNTKKKELEKRGIEVFVYKTKEDVTTEEVKEKIKSLKEDGIIVQLPLPRSVDKGEILNVIPQEKDVDLLSFKSCGLFYQGISKTIPPVVGAVKTILKENNISIKGKKVTIVGAGDLVGKPLSVFFMRGEATVSVANRYTDDLKFLTKNADIVVSGAGFPELIKEDMIEKDTVVIDAGTSIVEGKTKGDVDKEGLKMKTGLFSPVPKGIGPLTVYFLAENLLKLKKNEF